MKTTLLAAAAAVMAAALPAFAQAQSSPPATFVDRAPSVDTGSQAYQSADGPVLGLDDRVPASNTGSAGYQRSDGPALSNAPERMMMPNSGQAEPQSANSLPPGF